MRCHCQGLGATPVDAILSVLGQAGKTQGDISTIAQGVATAQSPEVRQAVDEAVNAMKAQLLLQTVSTVALVAMVVIALRARR